MAKGKSLYEEYVEKIPDQSGKAVAITGTTSGTGYWIAVTAIRKNASHLFLINRNSERSKASFEKLAAEVEKCNSQTKLHQIDCDLMKFNSVREAAAKINDICQEIGGLDVLGNNAGIMLFPDNRTDDGYDVQMQTNHLSHFLLSKLLMPSLELAMNSGKEARIVQQSSGFRYITGDPHEARFFEKSSKGKLGGDGVLASAKRYHQSKLANCTFALKLHEKLKEKGFDVSKMKSVFAEPGVAKTDLNSTLVNQRGFLFRSFMGALRFLNSLVMAVQSAEDGSLPFCHACFMDGVESGDFYMPLKGSVGRPKRSIHAGVLDQGKKSQEKLVLDQKNQDLCWEQSEKVCGPFFS